jgi:hypothetical protein
MLRHAAIAGLASLLMATFLWSGPASAEPRFHECQKPVTTGVEVYGLRNVSIAEACGVALALYKWENVGHGHASTLYGCHFPMPEAAGYPYLKLRSFRGWRLSLSGPDKLFTMSRGRSSFHIGGTDFPLNCS